MSRDYKSPASALSRRKFHRQTPEIQPYHALVRDPREVAWQTRDQTLTAAREYNARVFPHRERSKRDAALPQNLTTKNQPVTAARRKIARVRSTKRHAYDARGVVLAFADGVARLYKVARDSSPASSSRG